MSVCVKCGFDGLEDGKACAVCGEMSVSLTSPYGEIETERMSGPPPTPRPKSQRIPSYAGGELYADRYRIEQFLGRGGMGSVYRVTDIESGEPRALKILHAIAEDEVGGSERFKREIGVMQKISHPAVPRIFGSGVRDGEMYFVAEFVEGENLRRILRERGPFEPAEAVSLAALVAEALQVAHENGVIHRDVKPHNIMLSPDGAVRLLDFGVARGVGIDMKTITATGMIVGTPEYMSPEQFEAHRVDARSDIYSLGVVLFELLTGVLPFKGDTPVALALQHTRDQPPAPRSIRDGIPAWLNRIVLRCLEKNPAMRFSTASDLAAELRRVRVEGPSRRRLPTGDWLVDDDGSAQQWALVLTSPCEKEGWATGMTLVYEERFYRLERIDVESGPPMRWTYRLAFWHEGEAFRKVVDYTQHAADQAAREARKLSSRIRNWLK